MVNKMKITLETVTQEDVDELNYNYNKPFWKKINFWFDFFVTVMMIVFVIFVPRLPPINVVSGTISGMQQNVFCMEQYDTNFGQYCLIANTSEEKWSNGENKIKGYTMLTNNTPTSYDIWVK